ncbi:MAG: (2Fe-2S)-binding protein [Rickettsiales bacterium]|nr:(2Fe-2S)-binding protein [Rickettsiales bacterium]
MDLKVNGAVHKLEVEPDTPLLWVLREQLGLTGTKFGCGIGACGACTVHLYGTAVRSCILPVAAAAAAEVTTIEGLSHPLQEAWIAEQVPQCGYCQSGQLMAAAALLRAKPEPTDQDIDQSMTNLCRCATYPRIRQGIQRAARALITAAQSPEDQQQSTTGTDMAAPSATDQQ